MKAYQNIFLDVLYTDIQKFKKVQWNFYEKKKNNNIGFH